MGTSTDGQICYGVVFEEEHEFPWDGMEFEEWWREVNGCPIQAPCEGSQTGTTILLSVLSGTPTTRYQSNS